MIKLVIIVVVLALAIFGIVKLLDKNTNTKLKPIISIVLWAVTLLFGYLIYESIQDPIRFDKLKEKRFSGTFTNETIYQALAALKLSYPLSYAITNRLVIIKD